MIKQNKEDVEKKEILELDDVLPSLIEKGFVETSETIKERRDKIGRNQNEL